MTELKKTVRYAFHSYDGDIDVRKLSDQSPLKYLLTEVSKIYAKLLFRYALTGCVTTSSINGVGKATVLYKKLLSNIHLQEAALVFTSSSKSHEEIESVRTKSIA